MTPIRAGQRVYVPVADREGVVVSCNTIGGLLIALDPRTRGALPGRIAALSSEVLPEPTHAECAAIKLPAWLTGEKR